MKSNKMDLFRIGAYVRVSTEEQAENPEGSIRNQEMRLRDYVKMKNQDQAFGEITEVFTDPGISAKDMNRPNLQRLLNKIRTKEINLVLVTELSRLTRSTKDFSLLWEFMSEHNCKFLSLRDNFDSTTPAGEMIMFTLANFAQFERRQTSERIANSFQARSKRGLWNGGVLPLGYEVDELKPGHLKIVSEEAEIVREVFKTFLKEETIAQTAKSLNARGIKLPRAMRGSGCLRSSHFRIDNTHGILKNKAYIGVRVYKTKDGTKEAQAVWEGIIEPFLFDRVQKILEKNYMRKKPSATNRYPYTLSGILFCKTCGDRLCGKSAHGKKEKIAYYEHAWSTKNQSGLSKKVFSCDPNRILAKKIEPVVWEDVKRALNDESYARLIFEEARAKYQGQDLKKKELEKLKNKISSLQNQIEVTTERITELPKGIDAKVFYTQILKLQEQKTLFEEQLQNWEENHRHIQEQEEPLSFEDFKKFTEGLKALTEKCSNPVEQAGIIHKLVARIEVTPNGIVIHYYVGTTHFWRELGDSEKINGYSKGAVLIDDAEKLVKTPYNNSLNGSTITLNGESEFNFNADFTNKKGLVDLTKPASKPLLKYRSNFSFVGCSNTLTSGSQTHTLPELLQPHKTIELSSIRQQLISEELVKMYQSGMSLCDLAKQTGIAQTTIRARLIKSGIEMRPKFSIPFEQAQRKTGKRNILPYYGFCYFQGRVVPNPKEYDNLMKIYNLWKMGMNPNAISEHLNCKKIPPRSATSWNRNSIVNIINRFEKRLIVFKNGQLEFQ